MNNLKVIFQLVRPGNWIKNIFVVAPAFFAGELFHIPTICSVLIAIVAFCLCSSAVYCMNDVIDSKADRLNPAKASRPVASGRISTRQALFLGFSLAIASLLLSTFTIGWALAAVVLGYLLLNVLYSLWLKRIAIIDITVIAIGFILRLYAGSISAGCHLSQWIVLLTFLLSLFLALGKRREDADAVAAINADAEKQQRPTYTIRFIDNSMSLVGAAAITAYFLYTLSPNPGRIVSSQYLYVTGIPVVVGILRYLQICIDYNRGATHHRIMLSDPLIIICFVSYLIMFLGLWLL